MNIGTLNIEMTANSARLQSDLSSAQQMVGQSTKGMINSMLGVTEAYGGTNMAAQRLINALKLEADTYGMTREQLTLYKASLLGVEGEAQKLIDRINKMRDAEQGFAGDTNAVRSAVASVSQEVQKASGHMEGFNLSTAGARRELLVLVHEASQGNWKNFGGSLLVLAERTDFLKVALSGTGVAVGVAALAIGGFAFAAISGAKESAELAKQIGLTGGYAGITAGQFNAMAASISSSTHTGIGNAREALQGFVSSGRFASDTIDVVTKSAVEFGHQSGMSTEDVVADFQKMTDGVTKWASEHDKQYHFLTAAQYDQIRTLEDQGKVSQAVQVTMEALDVHLQSNTRNLGYLETAWNTAKNAMSTFWDKLKDLGRDPTVDDKIAQTARQLKFLKDQLEKEQEAGMGSMPHAQQLQRAIQAAQAKQDVQDETRRIEQMAALRKSEDDQRQAAAVQAMDADKKLKDSLMSRSDQEKKAIEDYLAGQAKIKAADASRADSDAKVAEIKAAIHEKYKVQNAESVSQYQHLVAAIKDKIAAQELQNSLDDKMTEGEKIALKFKVDLENGTIKLTAAEKLHIETLKSTIQAMTDKLTQDELDYRAKQAAIQQANDLTAAGDKMLSDLDQQIEKQRDFNDAMGLSKEQVDKLKAQKQLESAASDEQLAANMRVAAEVAGPLHDAYIQYANDLSLAAEKKRTLAGLQIDASEKQSLIDAAAEAQKQADKYQAAWEKSNKAIGDGLYSALSTGGDTAVKKLIKDLKEWFARLVLQPVIAPIAAFGASLINPMAASAQGTLGGQLGGNGVMNFFSAGKTLFEGFNSAFSLSGLGNGFWGSLAGGLNGAGIGSGLSSELGITIGNKIASIVGPSISGSISTGLQYAVPIAQSLGMLYMANSLGKSISGGMSIGGIGSNALVNIGTLLGGIPGAIGAGLLNRAFGMGEKQINGTSVTGTIGTDDIYRNVSWHQDGGWFRSDRNGVWSTKLANSTTIADGVAYYDAAAKDSDSALLKTLNDTYAQLKSTTADYAKALGLNTDSIKSRTDQINFAIGKDANETQQNITKMFSDLGDKIASELLGPLATLSKSGESASATMTRLATETKSVDAAVAALGLKFGTSGFDENLKKFYLLDNTQLVSAKDRLVNASGGIDSFNSQAQFFGQNFLTQAEQIKPVIDSVTKTLSDMGLSSITTVDQFKKLVQGLDLSTDAGANMYAKLMALAPAFKQMTDYNDSLAQSLKNTNASIQQQIDSLKNGMLTTDQQRAAQLAGVDDSTAALLRNLFALQDQKKALDAATAAADTLASTNANIQQQINQLKDSQLTQDQLRQKQLNDATDESTKALLRQLYAEQDKIAATKAAQDAASAAAQAEQQATQAAQQLAQAWQSVADSIVTEINRLRGLVSDVTPQGYAEAQAKFAITTAQAKAGDQDAARSLPQLSQALMTLAEQNASTAEELARIRTLTANSLADVVSSTKRYGVNIPGFASGGDFGGGIRLVGENGPELEVTGPSRIFNASQTAAMLNSGSGDVVAELRSLREEVAQLRRSNSAENLSIASSTGKTAKVLTTNDTGSGIWFTQTPPT